MLNVSLHTASIAVITHGRYSGRHPAITAFTAIFPPCSTIRRSDCDHLIRSSCRSPQHCNTRSRGRNNRKPIGPPTFEHRFKRVFRLLLLTSGRKPVTCKTCTQCVDEIRVDAHRTTPVASREGQPLKNAGDPLPLRLRPTDRRSSSDCRLPLMSVGTVSMS